MAEQPTTNINGIEKAAVFLRSIGEMDAAEVLKHMEPKDVEKIGQAMAALKKVSHEDIHMVMNNFMSLVEKETGLEIGSHDYVNKMLVGALGEERGGNLLNRILNGNKANALEQLKWLDARSIYDMMHKEHPQVIAIVCSSLEAEQAAQVLDKFPDSQKINIIERIATLDEVSPSALNQLNQIIESQVRSPATSQQPTTVGGSKSAANILNFMNPGSEAAILEQLKDSQPELAELLEDMMFVFENLGDVDDRGIQTLMREIQTDRLQLALKGADDTLKEKFLKNMSQRAAEMLRDDLEAMGPVKISDVEAAQKEIIASAKKLAESGDIMLAKGGGDDFI